MTKPTNFADSAHKRLVETRTMAAVRAYLKGISLMNEIEYGGLCLAVSEFLKKEDERDGSENSVSGVN